MNTVKVYKWKKFDINTNEYKIALAWLPDRQLSHLEVQCQLRRQKQKLTYPS
jgi:hypothetical protein